MVVGRWDLWGYRSGRELLDLDPQRLGERDQFANLIVDRSGGVVLATFAAYFPAGDG